VSQLNIEIVMPFEWDKVDNLRKAVRLVLLAGEGTIPFAESLSMVSAELLENAIKYGRPGPHGLRFLLRQQGEDITIRVTHDVDRAGGDVEALSSRLAFIRSFEDPGEAFVAVLAGVFERGDVENAESGLGLVRIAHEGHCRLELDTPEPGIVSMVARRSLPTRKAA
jgi:hypothetical protein